jgi:3-oxoacyl-[acyl-carrier protein] reductase
LWVRIPLSVPNMKILLTGSSRGVGKQIFDNLSTKYTVHGISSKEYDLSDLNNVDKILECCDYDVIINNAGVCLDQDLENPENVLIKTFNINVLMPILLTEKLCSKWKKEDKKGIVINIGSRVAFKGSIKNSFYAASKSALMSYTNSMGAKHAKDKIYFYGIAPSWIKTDMLISNMHDSKKELENLPIGRFLESDELNKYINFLLENDCSYMTGQILHLNGASYFV